MRRATVFPAVVMCLSVCVARATEPADPPVAEPRDSQRQTAPDAENERTHEQVIERRLTMRSRVSPDAETIQKLIPKAPAVPRPAGKVVRVSTAEQLRNAIESVEDNTTILVADGTYYVGNVLLQGRHGVTIRSEGGDREKVILDGAKMRSANRDEGTARIRFGLRVRGVHDFAIADLTMQNYEYPLFLYGDSDIRRPLIHNLKFRNIWVRAVKGTGARRIRDSSRDLLSPEEAGKVRPRDGRIQYCLFLNERAKAKVDDGFGGDYVGGIDMMWLKNWTISDNVFVGIRGANGGGRGAIFVWVNSEDVVAERNVIVNCDRGIAFGNPSGQGPHMTHGVARNNFIVAGARQAIEFHQTVDSIAANNTVYARDLAYRRTIEFQTRNGGARFLNNLVHGKMYMQDGVEQAGNIVGDLAGWFVNPAIGDLHLTDKAGEARDKAVPLPEVRDDFDMRRRRDLPDIGADEAGAHRRADRRWPTSRPANPPVEAVLRIAPKAPPLPEAKGEVVRVATAEQLREAIETVRDGATILLADGVYPVARLQLQDRCGVTIRSASGDREKVILDGEDLGTREKRHWALALHGTPDFTIADMTMRNFDYGVYIYGDGNVQRPLIHNMKFQNIWVRGVKGTHAQRVWDQGLTNVLTPEQTERVRPHDGRIQYCLFLNDRFKENINDGFHGNYISGIDMMWLRNWVISDNVFIGIRGNGGGGRGAIFTWVCSENVVAERNIIVNCDRGICFGNPYYVKGEEPHMTYGIARNNFIVAGARQAIEFHRTEHCMAYHNTIYGPDMQYEDAVEFGTRTIGARFFNNLVHGRTNLADGTEARGNIVGSLAGWFVDAAAGDLHLTDKAVDAVGKGVPLAEVTEDFDRRPRGDKPCVGAAEMRK